MKISKGKKSGIKNQKKKSLVRYKTNWRKNAKGYNECDIVDKPDALPAELDTPLKDSTKALKMGFPASYEDVKIPEDLRIKAEVIPIAGRVKLHSVTEPTKQELEDQIAKLSEHIEVTKITEEGAFVGPPKPELSAANDTHKVEATRKAIPDNVHELVPKYGKIIRDVGDGMTPSGQPISSFSDGSWKPTSWVVQPEPELHSVMGEDYTYEELASMYDDVVLSKHDMKVRHDAHVGMLNDHIKELSLSLLQAEDYRRTKSFLEAHNGIEKDEKNYINKLHKQAENSASYIKELQTNLAYTSKQSGGVTVLELQEDMEQLRLENSNLRKEIEGLQAEANLQLYTLEQMNRNNESVRSKPPLKTLANQFNTYMVQHRDDPVTNFFRRSGYCDSQIGELKLYLDRECLQRLEVSSERQTYRKWNRTTTYKVGKGIRILNEIKAIRSIALNAAILRPDEVNDWHCKVLSKVTQCNDVGAANIYDKRFRPLASTIDPDEYSKVWAEFTYVMTRDEFVDWEKEVAKQKLYDEVSKTSLFKVAKPLVVVSRKISKVLNYELSAKKRNEATRKAASERSKAEEQASSIKRMREAQFEDDVAKEVLRRRMCGLPDNV